MIFWSIIYVIISYLGLEHAACKNDHEQFQT